MKDSFILYTEQKAVIDKLTDEQAGKLIKAIYEYVATDNMPELDCLLDLVVTPIRQSLDKNKEKYEEVSKKRAEAGAKGGKQKIANQANAIKCKQSKANQADNEYEYEYDNEYDNGNVVAESDSCADGFHQSDSCVDEIVTFYEKNFGMIAPYEFEVLDSYRQDFPDEVIVYTLKLQAEAKATGIKYAKAILNSWKAKNIKTLIEAMNENKQISKKTEKTNNTYHSADDQYSNLDKFYAN